MQVVEVFRKSPLLVPVMAIDPMVSVAVPEFLSVTVLTALFTPVATVPKFRLVGVSVTAGPPLELKVAVTAFAAFMVKPQVPVPLQAPLHPAKVEPDPGTAVKTTAAPLVKFALQVLGQVMPLGLLLTEPVPVPARVTVSGNVTVELKVAVTALAALMVTEQVPVPLQAPLHPAKVEPEPATAVKTTVAPLVKFALHVLGQVMPLGLLVTVPVPVPANVTESANELDDGTSRKTVSSAKSERTQFVSAEPQAVRLKVTEVTLGPV
jgi:hypothetical protein